MPLDLYIIYLYIFIISPRSAALHQNKHDYDLFAVAQNLQNIIQEQIQSLSSGTSLLPNLASTVTSTSTSTTAVEAVAVPNASASSVNSRPTTYSVVPTAASMATASAQHGQPTASVVTASNSNLNSNAQAALMILLTAQMQSQSGEPSLLQNPQVVSVLQNLVNNAG